MVDTQRAGEHLVVWGTCFLAGLLVSMIVAWAKRYHEVTVMKLGIERMIRNMVENATTADEMERIYRLYSPPKKPKEDTPPDN